MIPRQQTIESGSQSFSKFFWQAEKVRMRNCLVHSWRAPAQHAPTTGMRILSGWNGSAAFRKALYANGLRQLRCQTASVFACDALTVSEKSKMLKCDFDPAKPYCVVIYARMSDKSQNPRSPDQQIELINDLMKRLQLPWRVIAIYRDDGISGRYHRKRKGFTRMLRDLKSGACRAQLVLVDTFERLSRADNSAQTRDELADLGILVLTADSRFQDPTTPSGRALGVLESFRAAEDGKVKAHNVVRGKRDAVKLGHWPGGPIPFGFRLRNVMMIRKGIEEIDHRVLEPVPELRWIVELIFQLADERAWGSSRISQHLNEHADIPSELKPFLESTIYWILNNHIYFGEMVWGRNCTGIVKDVRVLQKQDEADWQVNPNFCEPLIERSQFDRVQANFNSRRKPSPPANDKELDIAGLRAKGVALTYPLSGLVVCDCCGRAMVASSGGAYTTTTGAEHRYVHYVCPGSRSGACGNTCHISESWLREVVTDLIRTRLFLSSETED